MSLSFDSNVILLDLALLLDAVEKPELIFGRLSSIDLLRVFLINSRHGISSDSGNTRLNSHVFFILTFSFYLVSLALAGIRPKNVRCKTNKRT